MREVSGRDGIEANGPEAENCLQSSGVKFDGEILPSLCFAVIVRDLWGVKAPIAVEQYSKRPPRTCRAWSSGESDAPFGVGLDILRSPEGYRFLARAMRDQPPEWWVNFLFLKACAEAYEAQRKKIGQG